ncbi:putative plastid developmental protein DAG [Corchorus capsularis]|uniref:Putative plastid developmental protein DAG n=1 Tax=Corchorus capsularis TaxID=210143 RepID=A0A1R3KVN3_COCAP|nr:putative plastid developmental protein DAG [Corchorus capsularis]
MASHSSPHPPLPPSAPWPPYFSGDSGSNNTVVPERVELTREPSVVEGCDYEQWFVVMEAPKGRDTHFEMRYLSPTISKPSQWLSEDVNEPV